MLDSRFVSVHDLAARCLAQSSSASRAPESCESSALGPYSLATADRKVFTAQLLELESAVHPEGLHLVEIRKVGCTRVLWVPFTSSQHGKLNPPNQ